MLTPFLLALMLQSGAATLAGPATAALAGVPVRLESVVARLHVPREVPAGAQYLPASKAVSTWQAEARRELSPGPLAFAAVLLGAERPVVTRCVKLNNPWCIKRARWPGEIGSDDEGHTAFADLASGADAAARLLRSYYVAFARHSALDIVRRWAPAECRVAGLGDLGALSVRGLGMTLRARFLVSRNRAGRVAGRSARPGPRRAAGPAPGRVRVSIVPLRAMPSYRVPDIAAGMGERRAQSTASILPPKLRHQTPRPQAARRVAASSGPVAAPGWIERIDVAGGAPACGGDETRIQNYAARIAGSVGLKPADDLKLFDAEGRPAPNLPAVMLAMSSVELGYLYAGASLIEGAVGRLALAMPPAAGGAPAMQGGPEP